LIPDEGKRAKRVPEPIPALNRESRPILGTLLVALILACTAVTVVLMGIFAAYFAVTGILHAFAYGSRQRTPRTAMLVPSQSPAGGD
jgi:hypothetical protein